MNLFFKDLTQFIGWIVTVVGGLIAAFKAIYELRQSREQRIRELRWKQANAAKQLLDELFSHDYSENAVLMLDWHEGKREYEVKQGKYEQVSYNDVISALQKKQSDNLDQKEQYIRECFDFFLYFLDRIEHYIEIELINFKDVEYPLRPYVRKMNNHRQVYEDFMKAQGYEIKFFRRYDDRAQQVTALKHKPRLA